jgi:hypothetical protein
MSAVSERSKLRSGSALESWWISTASVFVPASSDAAGIVNALNVFSAAPEMAEDAYDVLVIVPAGMLERTISVPFRYTTAPSSRLSCNVTGAATVPVTVNWRRK